MTEIEVTVAKKSRTREKKPADGGFKSFRTVTETDEFGNVILRIQITQKALRDFLRDNVNIEDLYDDVPNLLADELYNEIDTIKFRARRFDRLNLVNELVEYLEEVNKDALSRLANMTEKGQISFGLLKALFSPSTEIVLGEGETSQGAKVIEAQYGRGWSGPFLQLNYEYITTNGRTFSQQRAGLKIPYFRGVREISKLPIRPLSVADKDRLLMRGRRYAEVAIGSHYQHYTGHMQVKKWWSWDNMRSDGRIMVDVGTYDMFVSEYRDDDDESPITQLTDETAWMTEPYIRGFSFSTKQWGRFAVERITPIQFRDDAFDQLVLADDKKELVRALVTNGTGGFQDIISGKGGGCIFLLHGEPGVGKTLTAEAVSELLHRPLYSVSVGELGVNTADLEKNLRQILDVAQIWNAVILIDEADIFLEKRTSGDILRNAMVGIFLRLLEYHQGVLFLTTNRVNEFDPAFHSRISVALKYAALSVDAREKIWTNLLAAANITGLDPAELALVDINGRQIKTTIRLAQGLARQQGVPVNNEHVASTLAVSQQFQKDLRV